MRDPYKAVNFLARVHKHITGRPFAVHDISPAAFSKHDATSVLATLMGPKAHVDMENWEEENIHTFGRYFRVPFE